MSRHNSRLTIEAGMRGRKSVLAAKVLMNAEVCEAVHAFKLLEAVERDLSSTSNELQELGALFLAKRSYCSPEPLDLRRAGIVVLIVGVCLPVGDIDVR